MCDKKWDKKDATAICNQLGYPTNCMLACNCAIELLPQLNVRIALGVTIA